MKEIQYGPLTLAPKEGCYCVVNCEKDVVTVEIPARIWEIPVVAIGDRAFEDCVRLERVVLPEAELDAVICGEALSEIGQYAFSGCIALAEIEIPDSVAVVERGAFYGCEALKRAVFSERTYLAPYVFGKCSSLKSVSPLKSVSEGLFFDCRALERVILLDGCTEIDEDAFEHCESLQEAVLPASVQRVEALAFRSCYALKSVQFENPDGWYASNRYNDRVAAIDVSDPEDNARALRSMDFDDGIIAWYRARG